MRLFGAPPGFEQVSCNVYEPGCEMVTERGELVVLTVVQPATFASVPAVTAPTQVAALLTFQLTENAIPVVGAVGDATKANPFVDVGGFAATVRVSGGLTSVFCGPPGELEQVSCSLYVPGSEIVTARGDVADVTCAQPTTFAAVPAVTAPTQVDVLPTFQLTENGTPAIGAAGVAASSKPLLDVGGFGGLQPIPVKLTPVAWRSVLPSTDVRPRLSVTTTQGAPCTVVMLIVVCALAGEFAARRTMLVISGREREQKMRRRDAIMGFPTAGCR